MGRADRRGKLKGADCGPCLEGMFEVSVDLENQSLATVVGSTPIPMES
jgi:hypothetical protein